MADIEYFDEPQASGGRGFGFAQWIGAACSLGLVVGMIVWAIGLTLRDVSDVPVIQALEGPMRVRPDDPGGVQAAYQGYTVNDIKAGGAAAPAPERVVLAPAPIDLDAPAEAIQTSVTASAIAPAPIESEEPVTGSVSSEALAALLDGATALEPLEPLDQAPEAAEEIASVGAIPASVPGVSRSIRPVLRPANLRRAAPAPAATPVAAVTTSAPAANVAPSAIDVSTSDVPAGTRLVQLGAFDDPDTARREWDRLYAQFGDYMEGKQRLVQQARSGGRDFYRLRVVGFEDANASRRFCSAFLAQNAACIPVVSR